MALDPQNPNVLYAAQADWYSSFSPALFKSFDAGETWTKLSTPVHFYKFAIHPQNSDVVYAAGGYSGLRRSMPKPGRFRYGRGPLPQASMKKRARLARVRWAAIRFTSKSTAYLQTRSISVSRVATPKFLIMSAGPAYHQLRPTNRRYS